MQLLDTPKSRTTKQRGLILEELRRVDTHPTADEIFGLVRRKMPRISLGTVYRNLEVLAEQGLVLRLDGGGGQRRFDARTEDHYHVRCLGCGRVADLPSLSIEIPEREAAAGTDFQVVGFGLEFLGICPECQAAAAALAADDTPEGVKE
ncbi:MAG: transcriptional repressor [Proteobacteria bacterium]|nr:transcriptional repressor [Pseudomonadota bacterium]MBU1741089.1 transcriptional repressor [Pseudomonadota bacterium]